MIGPGDLIFISKSTIGIKWTSKKQLCIDCSFVFCAVLIHYFSTKNFYFDNIPCASQTRSIGNWKSELKSIYSRKVINHIGDKCWHGSEFLNTKLFSNVTNVGNSGYIIVLYQAILTIHWFLLFDNERLCF